MRTKFVTKLVLLGLLSQWSVQTAFAQKTESKAPFELADWYLGLPVDEDGNGKSDTISGKKLESGWTDSRFFYHSEDGGLTFRAPCRGALTSSNTTYVRTELREMLKRGNSSIPTSEPGKNNWVLSTASTKSRKKSGGVNGELLAKLAVNHVTTTGKENEVGRVIIGQIHGKDDEPVRLYYRKLPGHQKGSLYFAHEVKSSSEDVFYNLLGDRSDNAEEPADGIALDEVFTYTIVANGFDLEVSILQENVVLARKRIDMSASGYDTSDEYLYFKAGVYNQNKTGDDEDYAQATFYELTNRHSAPK